MRWGVGRKKPLGPPGGESAPSSCAPRSPAPRQRPRSRGDFVQDALSLGIRHPQRRAQTRSPERQVPHLRNGFATPVRFIGGDVWEDRVRRVFLRSLNAAIRRVGSPFPGQGNRVTGRGVAPLISEVGAGDQPGPAQLIVLAGGAHSGDSVSALCAFGREIPLNPPSDGLAHYPRPLVHQDAYAVVCMVEGA